jgi:hypothetical protein
MMMPSDFATISGALTLDAVNEGGWITFRCNKALTITKVKFSTGNTVTTGGTLRCGIVMLDASGNPDIATPTWAGATGNGFADVVVANGAIRTWHTGTLGEAVTLVPGTYYACGVYVETYVAQNLLITRTIPYQVINNRFQAAYAAAAWITRTGGYLPAVTMETADGTQYEMGGGLNALALAIGSGSANNEYGNVFRVPVPITVCGIGVVLDTDYTYTARLYQGVDTVLGTATIGDVSVPRASTSYAYAAFDFDSGAEVPLYPGIDYRMAIQFTHATTSQILTMLGTDKAHFGVIGFANTMWQTSRTYGVGNAWTDDETRCIAMCLLVCGQPAPTFPAAATVDPLAAAYGWAGEYTPGMDVSDISNVTNVDTLRGVIGGFNVTNLAPGNVRPVTYGVAETGDLSNLVATDAAYVALENSRNNDNGTVAADIIMPHTVKIRNTTITGTGSSGTGTDWLPKTQRIGA